MSSKQLLQKIYSLTPMQEGILYHTLREENQGNFIVQLFFSVEGPLSLDIMNKSMQLLVQRHDVFRTLFNVDKAKRPIQMVVDHLEHKIVFQDLTEKNHDCQMEYISHYADEEKMKGFDVTAEMLVRLAVFQTNLQHFRLLLSFHHIIVDGWSLSAIVQELFEIYSALSAQRSPVLREIHSFQNYIEWLNRQDQDSASLYWNQYLEGIEQSTALPWQPKQKKEGYLQEQVKFTFDREMTKKIKELALAYRVTMNAVIQAIWSIVLKRYNDTNDVVFGTVVSGRHAAVSGIDQMIGIFINTNPVRINFEQDIDFEDLLILIHKQMIDSQEHSHYPLMKIQAATPLKENLINHIVVFENVPLEFNLLDGQHAHELRIYDIELKDQTNYDFNIIIIPSEEISVCLKYNAFCYSHEDMQKVAGHIRAVTTAITENPHILVRNISILTPDEKERILTEFNNTDQAFSGQQCLHEYFEDRVIAYPNKTALILGEQNMSYEEVNKRANQLARILRRKGVGSNRSVGIMVERSFEMIIAILAIHKAGGAYIPIDPAYPKERVRYMLQDSVTNLVLTKTKWKECLSGFETEILLMDVGLSDNEDDTNLNCVNKPEDMAYIMYTSGSTGKPKGVIVQHRSVVNNMLWMQRKYSITEADVIMQKTSYTFDVSVFELCWWYFQGAATLCLLEPGAEKDPESIIRTVEQKKVTVIHFVPSMLHAFLDYLEYGEGHIQRLSSIQKVFTSGEALTCWHVQRFNDRWRRDRNIVFSNLYGPTEGTIHDSYFDCPSDFEMDSIPIGKPIDNIQMHIIDQDGQLQPIGVAGELCISGTGVAAGYVNLPEATEEKFVRDPFRVGQKMYKTGDLARWKSDGNIEYMGRKDFQIKIRGYRIEIGEIENVLHQYPGIQQALVTVYMDAKNNGHLCAYIMESRSINENSIKEYLIQRVPDYMVPSYFIKLDRFPLSQSGKIDRRNLPVPDIKVKVSASYTPPRNHIETVTSEIWEEVLGVEKVGIHDHFFALGGDSIKAIQVSSRLQRHHVHIGIKDIFANPTIAQLTQVLAIQTKVVDQSVVEGIVPLTPIQKWFFEHQGIQRHHWNQSFMLYRKEGFEPETLQETMNCIIYHHDALRMVYASEQDSIVQTNQDIKESAWLQVMDLSSELDVRDRIANFSEEIQKSMDLTTGPLLKAGLFQTIEGDYLLMVAHHLVIDGVSWRILLEDITQVYKQLSLGEKPSLPYKTTSYKSWASALEEYANSPVLLEEIPYWMNMDQRYFEPLPKDHICPTNFIKDTRSINIQLSKQDTDNLLRHSNQAYNTEINDLLLAALGSAFRDWTHHTQILIGLEGHGREDIVSDINVSRTIGWFTTMYPVVIDLPPSCFVQDTVQHVKQTLRQIPKKGIGYGLLKYVTALGHKKSMKWKLNPEVCFNYLGEFSQSIDQGVFTLTDMPQGQMLDPQSERSYSIDITAAVMEDELKISFIYNKHEYDDDTLTEVALNFKNHLLEIINHCATCGTREVSEKIYPTALPDLEQLNAPFALTDIQMAYFLGRNDELEMGGVSTHVYTEVETDVDMLRFNECLNKVIQRHPMLRAIIMPSGEQVILKDVPEYRMVIEDLRFLTRREQAERIHLERSRMSHHVFVPEQWPMFEFKALQLENGKYLLCMGRDLLIADAASMDIIGRDLMYFYHNPNAELPRLDFSFRDYILAYLDLKQSEIYELDRKYWLNKVEDFPLAPVLPLRCDPEQIKSPKFQRKEKIYNQQQWVSLKQLALQNGVTPSALLATIYSYLLSIWGNQENLSINLTVFNRYPFHEQVEHIVGDFTSNLLLGISFKPGMSFWEKARAVQSVLIDALEHRHYEGVEFIRDIVRHHGIRHGKAVIPYVFTSVLSENKTERTPGLEQLGNLKTGITQTSQVYIDFQATLVSDELWVFWDYVEKLFAPEMIEGMFRQFTQIIDSLLLNTMYSSNLEIEIENEEAIRLYNNTNKTFPPITLHGLFEEQAGRSPEAVALIYQHESLTYGELQKRSNQIARYLQEQGVCRGDYVSVLASRSIATIANVIGILKAGAAYVPVDPDYPEERRHYIHEHSQCKLTVGPELYDTAGVAGYSDEALPLDYHPDDVAYVIYTSGSTGRPKGVITTHGAVANTIQDINHKFGIHERDRMIGLSSMCFDLSVYDLFGVLAAGAALVLIDDQRDVEDVIYTIEHQGITIWNSVPAIMEMVLASVTDDFYNDGIRTVLLSGDWIPLQLPEKIKRHCPHAEVISLGGATEASIWSIYYPIKEWDRQTASIPYGRPLANQQMYVLNYELQPCPADVQGELYIGGMGLAAGYLNDEQKTRESFVEHPELGRLYRTGDYGVWRPAGYIEFQGRKDQQVKIRGYRVELGEIEGRLLAHEFIQNAVVVEQRDHRNHVFLCAYYVPDEEEVTPEELRIYLQRELPSYMVPSHYMELEKLPLSPNGKVNRRELPIPDVEQQMDSKYEEARNETEQKLTEIWKEVLDVERIGIHDHFFELGGNSILMVQIRTRISREMGIDLNLRDFLQHYTIAKLSERIKEGVDTQAAIVYPELVPDREHMYEPFPLTDVQMAYLMGREDHFEMGGVSTHGYTEIKTDYDIDRLNVALQQVIQYQPMMRAVVFPTGEQVILENVPEYRITVVDLTHMSSSEQQERIVSERERMSHYVFPTDQWPLFEYKAFKLSEGIHYLFISYDMLITDGASIQLIGKLLVKFYHEPNWMPSQLQSTFRDYILALQDFKNSETYKQDKLYWLNKLDDFPAAPELPLKANPSGVTEPRFCRLEQEIDRETWEEIKKQAYQYNITPTAALLAAYAEVMAFWSNQPHLAVSLTVFNRLPFHQDVNDMIGDFTSVILIEIDFRSEKGYWDRAKQIQERLLESLEHRHYDGIELIREISKYRNYGNRAVMPIVFTSMLLGAKERGEVSWYELGEIQMGAGQTSQVYLDHQLFEDNGSLKLVWDYVEQLFDENVIHSMFKQYIDTLTLHTNCIKITEQEMKLMESYNYTEKLIPYSTLHGLFEEQAGRSPEAVALIYKHESLTYEELQKRSNQIARYLQEQGVCRGDYVSVLASRSIATVANVIGILKAGAAYVPVDPDYPEERRHYIHEHSQCKLTVGPELYDTAGVAGYSDEALPLDYHPDDVAYVIYTSGSTGRPKGVITTHGAVANTIQDINHKFGIHERDRMIGLSSMCFDLSVYDLFGVLAAGAALVLIDDQRDVEDVIYTIEHQGITIWNSVPAIMEMVLASVTDDFYNDGIRTVLLSGDWIPLQLPEKIKRHCPHAEVISLGGATEASIWSIYYPIKEWDRQTASIPYGRPLANQQMYVLNYELQPCPADVQGELYIGGMGLAAGYLNDEQKTRESFVEHPELGRLYRTGDYGVWRPAGYIEFQGRKDQQVKIRGYRVELGEIEGRLLAHEFIQNAVVVEQRDHRNHVFLCAYYVPDEEEVTPEELRIYLQRELPSYMVPSHYMELEKLPLSPNGKVNRRELPIPDVEQQMDSKYEEARNETEQKLTEIWKEVLGVERIGIHDHFFELGGNSILMVQIRTRISREMGIELNLRDFLQHYTIAKLSERIKEGVDTQEAIVYPELTPDPEHMYEPFPLTDVQMAYLMGREDHFEMGGVSTHVYIELETSLDMVRFNRALQKVIERHVMLRTIILPSGQQQILDYVPEYHIEIIPMEDLSKEVQEQRILTERERMSHYIFRTDQWPLFEYKAFQCSAEMVYLFIGYDMLITDGASFQFIHQEIMKYYHDPDLELEGVDVTFRDYMMAYTGFKSSEIYKRDQHYWIDKLESFPEPPALPYVSSPSLIVQPRFERLTKHCNRELYEKLKQVSQKNHVTPTAVLCTVFAKVLSYWSNQSQLALNCTIFNRYPFHKDVYKMIGDFTSVMLLDITVEGGKSFWEQAESVQNVMMEALEHRHYDGIQFIREIIRQRGAETHKAAMPIVFTSMLLDTGKGTDDSVYYMGDVKTAVSQTSQVFLDYQVLEVDGGLTITWDYVEQLFDSEFIKAMFDQYFMLLEFCLSSDAGNRFSWGTEKHLLTAAFNNTCEEIPKTTLHSLFEQQVVRWPEAIAVIYKNSHITYQELNERSNRVARYLQEYGVCRGEFISVLANRSIETIVNIIGILKAGAAYVPIDPDYPGERREYIRDHCGCKLMLEPDLYVEKELAVYSGEALQVEHDPDDVAYVIYTSGSTGQPKGVIVTHGAVANTVQDINRKFNVNEQDRIIGLSSMCFDLSVYDLFGALAVGAALVLIDDQRNITEVAKTLEEHKITIWNSVPAIMDLMLNHVLGEEAESGYYWDSMYRSSGARKKNTSLRLVILSGDWIPLSLPDKVRRQYIHANVVSMGGATEASIWSIYYPVYEVREDWASIPYGMPLANQTYYVLNYDQELCPVGVKGELYIGGVGLAKGYLHEEEKTAFSFLNHPKFGRLYRTGDQGILNSKGYIEFLGRNDQQVKIRGYRVELGEIENQILQINGVKEAVVLYTPDSRGNKVLCAYIVAQPILSTQDIKEGISRTLPSYMVPTHFIRLEQIPLTPNGKLDRKALPEPSAKTIFQKKYEAPVTKMECLMVRIWEEILEYSSISVDDSLFELGVDSTSVIKFVARLATGHGIELPIRQIFVTPTIRELASLVSSSETQISDLSNERMLFNPQGERDRNIFCFPPVVALGVVYQRLAEFLSSYRLYSFNFLEIDQERLIAEYIRLIKEVQPEGPYVFLGISAGGNLAFEITKALEKQGDKVRQLILLDSFYITEINSERLTTEESRKYAKETVDLMLEKYPQLQSEGDFFHIHVGEKIQRYYAYLDNLMNSGQVAAHIHVIKSLQSQSKHIRGDIRMWEHSTIGKYSICDGYGDHESMLDATFVEQNAALILSILEK
ncbi:amino acid adenylation domain-containing protein [Paenibacillus polymyxa]|uniref:non-ribosomal peptide synthetase n=1 Tax=Paenibacillus polymyxa TaxID=1406 RepID=UPI002ED0A62F|nr:amino acid adenylation domain-containing protein [Paenibacillus polymyxa]